MGRTLPRLRRVAVATPSVLLAMGVFMIAAIPPYFAYCKAGDAYHSDYAITGAAFLLH